MSEQTKKFHALVQSCKHWPPGFIQRLVNIVNDVQDVDEEELQSAQEFVDEVNEQLKTG